MIGVPHTALKKGMMTYSGRMVSMRAGVPSLDDIALALSRIPRFGGHCRVDWTVLQHSLVCERIAHNTYPGDNPLRLACLLHDAHESTTGDIPTPMKVPALKVLQGHLDDRIFEEYWPKAWGDWRDYHVHVGDVDHRALLAEAVTVGPPQLGLHNVAELFRAEPRADDIAVVKGIAYAGAFNPLTHGREIFPALVRNLSKVCY